MSDVGFGFSANCTLFVKVLNSKESWLLSLLLCYRTPSSHANYTGSLDLPATREMCAQELTALIQEAGVQHSYSPGCDLFEEALDYIWSCVPENERAGEEEIYTKSISRSPQPFPPTHLVRRRP